MVNLTGLWKREGKNGPFLAGKIGTASIMVFPNKNKQNSKHPDYRVVIAEDKKKDETSHNTDFGGGDDLPF